MPEYPRVLATVDAYDQIAVFWAQTGDHLGEVVIPTNQTDPTEWAAVLLEVAQAAAREAYTAGRADALREMRSPARGLVGRIALDAAMDAVLKVAR